MTLKIGVITHYKEMESAFRHLYDALDSTFIYRVGAMEQAIEHARELQDVQKVDAIISSEATSTVVQSVTNVLVVSLSLKNFDLVRCFHLAHQSGEPIAFLEFRQDLRHYNFEQVVNILGYPIRRYQIEKLNEAQAVVDQAVSDGYRVIVTTGNLSFYYARKIGLTAVMALPDEQEFISAVDTIKNTLLERLKEVERAKWLNEIVQTSNQGILTLDPEEHITVANAAAENFLDLKQADIIGQILSHITCGNELFAKLVSLVSCTSPGNDREVVDIVRDGEDEFIVSRKNLMTDDGRCCLGNMIKINLLRNLRDMEINARKKLHEQGFLAPNTFKDILGTSSILKKAKDIAKRYAQTDSIILINGETGSGKELFAQSIHNYSSWSNGPFVAINCSTLSENLLESELFGYEDGAFTGARKGGRPGLFEVAFGGTFFMDEIGEMPLVLQTKLLRVLQERCVMRIGGNRNIPINVRIILATNRDLYAEVKAKRFREDLYYRINVLNLRIPALRERKEDIAPIVQAAIRKMTANGSHSPYLSAKVVARFQRYDWYGNVRELLNFVERLVAMRVNDISVVDEMLEELIRTHEPVIPANDQSETHLSVAIGPMKEMEQDIIKRLVDYYDGNKKKVEMVLEMSSTTLWRRFKEIGQGPEQKS